MFCRTEEEKVLRDPVHGYIHVDYQVVWDCINSRWFQRLRRIRQLGGAYMVYHTAEHSRFGAPQLLPKINHDTFFSIYIRIGAYMGFREYSSCHFFRLS